MYLTEMLGVIIGLIFVWLLISVVVEQVQEWIVGWLSIRADSLADTIWGMLNDPKKRAGPWGRLGEQFQKFFARRGWFQNRKRNSANRNRTKRNFISTEDPFWLAVRCHRIIRSSGASLHPISR